MKNDLEKDYLVQGDISFVQGDSSMQNVDLVQSDDSMQGVDLVQGDDSMQIDVLMQDDISVQESVFAQDEKPAQSTSRRTASSIKEFTDNWNLTCRNLKLVTIDDVTTGRPVQIDVRFSRSKFKHLCDVPNFVRFCQEVERRSRTTMFVSDAERLFENGIIEIKIAAMASNYDANVIHGVLRWITSDFFK